FVWGSKVTFSESPLDRLVMDITMVIWFVSWSTTLKNPAFLLSGIATVLRKVASTVCQFVVPSLLAVCTSYEYESPVQVKFTLPSAIRMLVIRGWVTARACQTEQ